MSFANNASNLTGKSTTNAFNVIANSLIVNKDTLLKGDLTVLGNTTIGDLTLENATVDNLTVNNFTAINPVPITSGGTGLAAIGTANQVLLVNPGGTALIYGNPGLSNPAVITGTGFTGSPTLTLGLEADTGSLGRGFIRTGPAAVNGLVLGTSSASVLRLWSNFSTDSNLEMSNQNANFTYNSSGTTGVFQVLNGGGSISFTNIGIGTISMATAIGAISLSTGAGSTSITTGAGSINLTTGIGNISLVTAGAGGIEIITATAGAINIGTSVGLVNLFGSGLTLGAPVIYIGTGSAVPIPSILTFACGAVTGITGAWTITTLAFQLNSLSISLNSVGTIFLNGTGTTINGSANVLGNVFGNANNLASTTVVNPAVFVYSGGGNNWGMDLGYKASTTRYRTRIFAPTGGDIALSIGSGSNQSDFSDKLIVHGDTGDVEIINGNIITNGDVEVNNGNIITNQNIIGGIVVINSGDLTLTRASPGYILILGGSGAFISLPDATTLIVGWTYTINNNTNNAATVFTSTAVSVGTVPGKCAATVTCLGLASNGPWDIHVTGPPTDWANPGQIGSAMPNTGIFTTLLAVDYINANATSLANTNTLGPAIYVLSEGGDNWGMDLGYNSTSARYRTRIFAPTSEDIALSIGTGSVQDDIQDKLIVHGDSGNVEVIDGNIITNQNIIGGVETINSGNLALTIASPGNILILGGSGSIITLPDATTLIVGYSYTINNNSGFTATVNRYTSGLVGTVPSASAATVTCIGTATANGTWDIHIAGPSTVTDWANPGQIGSSVPNTGIFTTLSAINNIFGNASNLLSTTIVNPAIYVYSSGGQNWGMDLGYKASSARFRTRIFAPTGGDIALSIGSGLNQSDFTDKLIVNSTSGNVEVINGNIITNQNIIGGVEIINSGNLTLTAASPGYILIKGGSGSIITLPDATTLIVGYIYTINNNSNNATTVNRYTSGLVGTVPALGAATVVCTGTASANGTWDIHLTTPQIATDWANPGQIGSSVPNTGIFTTLSATGNIFGNATNILSTTVVNPAIYVYSSGGQNWGMDLGYKASSTRFRTRIFAPTGGDIALSIGSGLNQSDFTDKLIVNSTSGNVEVINGNIITNQNIVGGIEIINSGNLALAAASPGYILIRGGSGSIITLPDATTLIVGYIYTINNNSNNAATVNRYTSGLVGTIPASGAATVVCTGTASANGQWDIHQTGGSVATDWANPGQIGSSVPNTGIFTTLSATGNIFGNAFNTASTTTVNPAIYVYSGGGNNWGMDLGYKAASARYRTRIFAPTGGDIAFSIGSGPNQSDFTDQLTINGTNGNIEISQNLSTVGYINANSSSQASTSSLNPSITIFRDSGQNYGMDLGYNATSARYRTRIFAPVTNGDIALSIGTGTTQASYTDRLIVRGDTGDVNIIAPITTVTGTRTEINGTSVDVNATVFQVNNTATATNSNIASFLQSTLATNQSVNLFLGKTVNTTEGAIFQYFFNTVDSSRSTTWGFPSFGDGRIRLRPNQATEEHISLYGRTKIYGDLNVTGTITSGNLNSSAIYNASGLTSAGNNTWTNINFLFRARSAGTGFLTWIDQGTGIRNDTGKTVLLNVAFSCQRTNDTTGITALRILFADTSTGVQDVSGLDAVSISANGYLAPGESLKCQIFCISATGGNRDYQNVYITVNLNSI